MVLGLSARVEFGELKVEGRLVADRTYKQIAWELP